MKLYTGKKLEFGVCELSIDITQTKKGYKIEGFSLDSRITDYIFYIDNYYQYQNFAEYQTLYIYDKCLEEMAYPGSTLINIYRTITK